MMKSTPLLLVLQALLVNAELGFMEGLGYPTRAPLPTAFSHPIAKRDIADCSSVFGDILSCEALTPGFTALGQTAQASCLCYDGSSWEPGDFDGAVSGCAAYARTASPTDYSIVAALNGFCTDAGDVKEATTSRRQGGATDGGSATATVATPTACNVVVSAVSYCNSVTPGFTTMPVSRQAPCLCYSGSSWMPNFFDGQVETCIDFASTASPSDASLLAPLEDFCTSAGDVFAPANTPASATASGSASRGTTPTTSFRTTTPSPTTTGIAGVFTNPACSFIGSAIVFCESVSPGFTSMASSSQAPCLCYSSSSYNPEGFDGPASTCADFVRTAQPANYSVFSSLTGFCTDVGDVLASTTDAGSATTTGGSGGGIGGIPADILGETSTTSTSRPRSTVTVQAAPTSTPNKGVPSVLVDYWAVKLVVLVMGAFALL